MDRTKEVLACLRNAHGYVSGDFMSNVMGISRTAIWKYIHHLEQMGYGIDKRKGRGYCLLRSPDRLYPWEIERSLDTTVLGKKIVYRDLVDSTNALAFELAMGGAPEGTCVIAETQNTGKGRLGRKWFSPAGKNLYLSVILRPTIPPSRIYPITFLSSLAACETIRTLTQIEPVLKWPNDVLVEGRKICGTLLELSTEADMVRFVIVGIGLNINMEEAEFDQEIRTKATSLLLLGKKPFERAVVCGILLTNLERHYNVFQERGPEAICSMWEDRAAIKGKSLEINHMGQIYKGVAQGIDTDGGILLAVNGTVQKIIAGDVNF